MNSFSVDVKKKTKLLSSLELNNLSKQELIDKVVQLEAHNSQLKNIISKKNAVGDAIEEQESKKQKRPFDFTRCKKQHIFLKLLYLGWDYQGFVSQEDTTETIEHHLFKALTKSCLIESRQTSNYHRCGRTDKGVSSFGQVISLIVRSADEGKTPLCYCKILNRLLPKDIRVLAWRPVPLDFSARFNCTKRTYKYFYPRGNLDIKVMQEAAQYLIGTHDFRNLCKMDVGNGVVNFIRSIYKITIEVLMENTLLKSNDYDMCVFTMEGQGFLWHQVRCIMGLLFLVGSGNESPQIIQQLLDVNEHPRKPQYCMAHDVPLNLFHCFFDFESVEGEWIVDLQSLSEVVRTLQQTWSLLAIKETMVASMLKDIPTNSPNILVSHQSSCLLQGVRPKVYIFDYRETMVASMLKDIQTNSPNILVSHQSSCLLQGVRPKVYIPVLQRPTCESLESRIEHYVKKRRLEINPT